ncbi:hypothetical protein RDI58_024012 [Solanum bulbocastanum]|uniref:RNase H type-1 domain-containing protein n=1 Tax=Solanum bulbocastanum TaxID=147425 RepID=A0AAN8Y2J5_SOLBU
MKGYRPKLHWHAVCWELPHQGCMKCNTNGASRENPRESIYSLCVKNHDGDLVYAEASMIGIRTNMEAETKAILRALRYCKSNNINNVRIETNSLVVAKMIRHEWQIPWNQKRFKI